MTRKEFNQDFALYTDRFKMIQDKSDGQMGLTSGNGNLYTAHYILAALDNGYLDNKTKSLLKSVYASNERESGLMMRAPDNRNGHNAHDDLIGCATASRFIDDGELARRIINYGRIKYPSKVDTSEGPNHKKTKLNKRLYPIVWALSLGKIKWNWNNINPQTFHVSSWLFRRSDVIATLELVAYGKTSFFRMLYLIVMLGFVIFENENSNHNSFILRYQMARAIEGKGPVCNFLSRLVRNRMVKYYGNFGNLIGAYFVNNAHPLYKWLQNSK